MNLLDRATERLNLSRQYVCMSRNFASGDLKMGTPGLPEDSGHLLAKHYRTLAIKARWSAMRLRQIALAA